MKSDQTVEELVKGFHPDSGVSPAFKKVIIGPSVQIRKVDLMYKSSHLNASKRDKSELELMFEKKQSRDLDNTMRSESMPEFAKLQLRSNKGTK